MSEKKLEEIETMFKKTSMVKLEINEIKPINKISVILDGSIQGKKALETAISLGELLNTSVDVIISGIYIEPFQSLYNTTMESIESLKTMAEEKINEKKLYSKINTVFSTKLDKVLEAFKPSEKEEEEKLSNKLINKLEEIDADLLIIGVPLFSISDEYENLGIYVSKLLRERKIHANILLVTPNTKEIKDSILAFVSIEQQPASIIALTKRALSLSTKKTKIHVVGMVEDRVIETVARVDLLGKDDEDTTPPDLEGAGIRLEKKMIHNLETITINPSINYGEFTTSVKKGSVSSILNISLEDNAPGIVLVRSVAEIGENLDPIAEQFIRSILKNEYPCLVVWD